MKRVVALLLTAAIALSVTACGGARETEQMGEEQMQDQTDAAGIRFGRRSGIRRYGGFWKR